ncbi:MAG: ABC transporter permease subunit [bacterium]|nr:ABC transporter permease subunit [bacterium]
MNGFLATLGRELRAYFFSPLAYVVLTFFLLVNGGVFSLIISYLNDPRAAGSATPLKMFFGDTFFFWVVLLMITPLLTMRLLSEERRSGTIEALMTAPVSEAQVVMGKYLAALAFYVFLWLPTLVYTVIIARNSEVDWGPIASGYLGVLGIGGVFLAIGVFGSSFTKNQIVAAVITFAMLLYFFAVAFLDSLVTSDTLKGILGYMNLLEHMDEFGNGVVDSRRLVYYVTTSALFLFLSSRALAVKKWR